MECSDVFTDPWQLSNNEWKMTSVFSFIILCIPIETPQEFVPVGVQNYQTYSLGDANPSVPIEYRFL